jgi:hypothetical protein
VLAAIHILWRIVARGVPSWLLNARHPHHD